MVCWGDASWTVGCGNLSPIGDLLDSYQFLFALRHLCEGVPLHVGCCLRGLHPRVLRYSRIVYDLHGCLRDGLVLSALCRKLLVWSALHLWSRCGFYLVFGNRVESHDWSWLHLRLSLLLSLVGAVGLLRTLLLGPSLG